MWKVVYVLDQFVYSTVQWIFIKNRRKITSIIYASMF
jgi:hypothetical protein